MRHPVSLKTNLPLTYRDVCDVLRGRATRALKAVAGTTVKDNHRLSTNLDVSLGSGTSVRRAVHVDLGSYTETKAGGRLAIHLAAATHPALFPTLDAEVIVCDLGASGTSVAIAGTIRDPLGPIGALGSAVGGHNLAESSLESFFTDLLARIGLEVREARLEWSPPLTPWTLTDR